MANERRLSDVEVTYRDPLEIEKTSGRKIAVKTFEEVALCEVLGGALCMLLTKPTAKQIIIPLDRLREIVIVKVEEDPNV